MVIIPKEQPVIENLNTYYLDVQRLIEHYQGELGSGGIYFNSTSTEGVIYFDKDDLLNAVFKDRDGELKGNEAIDRLIAASKDINFIIDVYSIDLEKVYFWANIPDAQELYKDLSTEFTDLNGLVNKMKSANLTGYIEVSINNGRDGGLIFYINGEIIGGSYTWGKGEINGSQKMQDLLIKKTKESGGMFHVRRIPVTKEETGERIAPDGEAPASTEIVMSVEELLVIFERILKSNKKIKADFNTLLRKKFVEIADKYLFLDPFAADFQYSEQKVTYTGDAADNTLVNGIIDTVKGIASDLGILPQVTTKLLDPWFKKYEQELLRIGISV